MMRVLRFFPGSGHHLRSDSATGRGVGTCVIECDRRLVTLFARSFPGAVVRAETVAVNGAETIRPADCDFHIAAGSLPALLRGRLDRFSGRERRSNLVAEPGLVAQWRQRLAALGPEPKIGLCWRSRLMTTERRGGYLALDQWWPVLSVPGVRFVNLQYDQRSRELADIRQRFGIEIVDWPDVDLMNDLEQVAALISALDLVITAPTSVGELAGSLGMPVWRVESAGDWTLLGAAVRPWFPSMRVFSCADDQLSATVGRVAVALRRVVAENGEDEGDGGRRVACDGVEPVSRHHVHFWLQAVTQVPERGENFLGLAMALERLGEIEPGMLCCRQALRLRPELVRAHGTLGNLLRSAGRLDQAEACQRRALLLAPDDAVSHVNLGVVLLAQDRATEAEAALRRALALGLERAEVHLNLGSALQAQGQVQAAAACYRRALALRPDFTDAATNLALLASYQGRGDEAAAWSRKALAAHPGFALAEFNQALMVLASGNLEAGWSGHDRRFDVPQLGNRRRRWPMPEWSGEALAGRKILVWPEQGLGDEVMFASCFPDLIARAEACVIECDPRLVPLFARSFPGATVRGATEAMLAEVAAVDRLDYHVPAGSLPRRLRLNLTEFPSRPGWLTADPERVAAWRSRLAGLDAALDDGSQVGPRVGICWRSTLSTLDRSASNTALDQWHPVLSVPGIRFVNLQYDKCEAELAEVERRFGVSIARWPGVDLKNDLEQAAALIAALDLVITAPTSVGELAGALAVPVWRLDSFGDWTMLGTHCRPWMPVMRLFVAGWGQPVAEMLPAVGRVLREAVGAAMGVTLGRGGKPWAGSMG
ncbi:hypothetical protein WCLP8_5490004 [uncultured Gammaproteobacteria bacterium]